MKTRPVKDHSRWHVEYTAFTVIVREATLGKQAEHWPCVIVNIGTV